MNGTVVGAPCFEATLLANWGFTWAALVHCCVTPPHPLVPLSCSNRRPGSAQARALCVAHVEAAAALARLAAAAGSDGSGDFVRNHAREEVELLPHTLVLLASNLAVMIRTCPDLLGPSAVAPLAALLPCLPQVR